MKRLFVFGVLALAAWTAFAQIPIQRVADDGKVIDRVAEASKKDLPQDLLKRIANEDIELLRGKRADGTYEYATYERLEAERSSEDFSIQPKDEEAKRIEIRGSFIYRLIVEVPSRRLLLAKNRRLFVDHVEIEYIPVATSSTRSQTVKIEQWLEPGQSRPIDLNDVARQATVKVFAKADKAAGYGNIVLTMVKAKVVDNADSPYADAVSSAKAIIRAVDNYDIPSVRSMAIRMHDGLEQRLPVAAASAPPPAATVEVVAPVVTPPSVASSAGPEAALGQDVFNELQSIEDLLTGSETDRRQGMDRLHQLVRRLRSR